MVGTYPCHSGFAYNSLISVCIAVCSILVSAMTCLFLALSIYPVSAGTSNAASAARITNTTINSTSVKPRFAFLVSIKQVLPFFA